MITDLPNKDVLAMLGSNTSVLEFMMRLKPNELSSLAAMTKWSPVLLSRLRDDPHILSVMHKFWDVVGDRELFIKTYLRMIDHPSAQHTNVPDAFTQGQLDSKRWLIDQTLKLDVDLGLVWILCGWVGTLGYLLMLNDKLRKGPIRSFDRDPGCAVLADMLNKPNVMDGWKFKATTMDVNDMSYVGFKYGTVKGNGSIESVIETPDTIINTSCDHMDASAWWNGIPEGKLVILQNNNLHGYDDHINVVDSIEQFSEMYPMSELMFSGSLDCTLYTRFMLIGRK